MPSAIIRYHEIALKGGNRRFFESCLEQELNRVLGDFEGAKVVRERDRFSFEFANRADQPEVQNRLMDVFGVANFSFVEAVSVDLDALVEKGVSLVREALESGDFPMKEAVSFRVQVKRRDKSFPKTSDELAREIGGRLLPHFNRLTVQLNQPQLTLYVEWNRDQVVLYIGKIPGAGGIPVGSSGKVLSLLSSGFDSPVASWMMMRRGAKVVFVHFHSYPAVGHESIDHVEQLVERLSRFQGESKLYLIPLVEYQKHVVAQGPAPLRLLLYRRMMLRLAHRVMAREEAKALVTGESLGQVASQTLDNLHAVGSLASRPLLRPLIGIDKQEIIELARRIGTAEISSQPYEDCCSLFVPKSPALAARAEALEAAEAGLKVDHYAEQLWDQREVKRFGA